MDDVIHTLKRAVQPVLVPHVPDEEAHPAHINLICIFHLHDALFILIPGIDNHFLWLILRKYLFQEFLAE